MELPTKVGDLRSWLRWGGAVVVGLFVASTVLGIAFTSVVIAVELGSVVAGLLAVIGALLLVASPLPAVGFALQNQSSRTGYTTAQRREDNDAVTTLKEQYVAGEIDEATFEQRLSDRLEDGDSAESARKRQSRSGVKATDQSLEYETE